MRVCRDERGSDEQGVYDLRRRYDLGEELDPGSSARVFRGWDPASGREVAVKVMRDPRNERQREDFRHGARVLRGITRT